MSQRAALPAVPQTASTRPSTESAALSPKTFLRHGCANTSLGVWISDAELRYCSHPAYIVAHPVAKNFATLLLAES